MASSPVGTTGAAPVGRRKRPWWLWLIIAVVVLALLILALVQCGPGAAGDGAGDGNTGAGAAATSAPPASGATGGTPSAATDASTPSGTAGSGAAGSSAGSGTLTAGGAALLPLAGVSGPNGELTGVVGQAVTAQGVSVQSVPSDEGFWLGTSETDRVWVQLTEVTGESPFQVEPGNRVDLAGTVVGHDGAFAQQVGVDPAEGADQLARQAAHVEVAQSQVGLTPA